MATPESKYKSRAPADAAEEASRKSGAQEAVLMKSRVDESGEPAAELTSGQRLLKKIGHLTVESIKQTVMIGLILAYAFGGAFAFRLLEEHNERANCMISKGKRFGWDCFVCWVLGGGFEVVCE